MRGREGILETPEFARAVFGTNERAITTFHKMVSSISAESASNTCWRLAPPAGATLVELVVSALPEKVSRHNSPISSHSIASMAKAAIGDRKRRAACVVTALPEGDVRGGEARWRGSYRRIGISIARRTLNWMEMYTWVSW